MDQVIVTNFILGIGFAVLIGMVVLLINAVQELEKGLGAVLRMVPAIQAMDRIINRVEVPPAVEGLRYKGDAPLGNGMGERQRPLSDYPSQGGVFFPHDVEGASRGVFTEPGPSVDEAAAELLARGRGD